MSLICLSIILILIDKLLSIARVLFNWDTPLGVPILIWFILKLVAYYSIINFIFDYNLEVVYLITTIFAIITTKGSSLNGSRTADEFMMYKLLGIIKYLFLYYFIINQIF